MEYGNGIVGDMCVHMLDLVRWQLGLGWPERIESGVDGLDLLTQGRLDFEAPDTDAFPCLQLAWHALEAGGTSPAVLNAANEVAVDEFLSQNIRFPAITALVDATLSRAETDAMIAPLESRDSTTTSSGRTPAVATTRSRPRMCSGHTGWAGGRSSPARRGPRSRPPTSSRRMSLASVRGVLSTPL